MELSKAEFRQKLEPYLLSIGRLQREALNAGLPVIITFDGFDAAFKGKIINRVLMAMDPRGYKVHPIHPPTCEEELYPFLKRFWDRIPPKGRTAVFDRSWHFAAVREHLRQSGTEPYASEKKFLNFKNLNYNTVCRSVRNFERTLTDNGILLIRFLLTIDEKEQKKRLKKISEDPDESWRVTEEEKQQNRNYDSWKKAWDEVIESTSNDPFDSGKEENPWFPGWFIIDAADHRQATLDIFSGLEESLRLALKAEKTETAGIPEPVTESGSVLQSLNLNLTLSETEYESRLDAAQKQLAVIQNEMYRNRRTAVIVFEGWDAAGKGGAIRRVIRSMDPRGYEVIPVAAPTESEKTRHYLWRFWRDIPKAGHITIFDRSWYGRVLVERVEQFASDEAWLRSYREINEFESELTDRGIQVIKFFIHIDSEEQLRRFEERRNNPDKEWKITDEDWRNREKWPLYEKAIEDMIGYTSSHRAPWYVIEGNCKYHARVRIAETLIQSLSGDLLKAALL